MSQLIGIPLSADFGVGGNRIEQNGTLVTRLEDCLEKRLRVRFTVLPKSQHVLWDIQRQLHLSDVGTEALEEGSADSLAEMAAVVGPDELFSGQIDSVGRGNTDSASKGLEHSANIDDQRISEWWDRDPCARLGLNFETRVFGPLKQVGQERAIFVWTDTLKFGARRIETMRRRIGRDPQTVQAGSCKESVEDGRCKVEGFCDQDREDLGDALNLFQVAFDAGSEIW